MYLKIQLHKKCQIFQLYISTRNFFRSQKILEYPLTSFFIVCVMCNAAGLCVSIGVCLAPNRCTRSVNVWTQIFVDHENIMNNFQLIGYPLTG